MKRTSYKFYARKLAQSATLGLTSVVPAVAFAIPGAGELTSLSSPSGREIADLYSMLGIICLVIFALVTSFMLVAIVRYRRKSEDEMPDQVHGNMKVEMGLLIGATLVQVFIGYQTLQTMWYVETMPESDELMLNVEAIAKKWDWKFRYPDNGGFTSEDLVIPAHENIKLEVTSEDILHSIFIPELGVKMDAVPGRYNYWWFNADGPINQIQAPNAALQSQQGKRVLPTTRENDLLADILNTLNFMEYQDQPEQLRGLESRVDYLAQSRKVTMENGVPVSPYAKYDAVEYRGMCTELCGSGHYNMYFRVVAMTPASFKQWVKDQTSGANKGPVNGQAIYESKCASCHKVSGVGAPPNFPPLAGSEWVNVDTEENKNRHIQVVLQGLKGEIEVKGVKYNGQMAPWYQELNDEEVAAVVNHERVSWGNNGGTVTVEQVAQLRESFGYPPFPAGGAEPIPDADLMARGKAIYQACTTCHGDDGQQQYLSGGVISKLAGNSKLVSAENIVNALLGGRKSLNDKATHPPMGMSMSNEELAAISTYVVKTFAPKKIDPKTKKPKAAASVQPDQALKHRTAYLKTLSR